MMIASGPHRGLLSTLTKLLNIADGTDCAPAATPRLKSKSIELLDFSARFKIIVSETHGSGGLRLELYVHQDRDIHDDSLRHLRRLYGPSVTVQPLEDERIVMFAVSVNEAIRNFTSMSACIMSLSQLRVQAVGAPIWNAFSRLERTSDEPVDCKDDFRCQIGSYERCGTFHCISTKEKAMVVFVVSFVDEMERSLARLFLQQFQGTQNKVPLTPHCEFRSPKNLTTELKSIADGLPGCDGTMPPPVGYLTFSFFSSNVATEKRRTKAVELLVNFLPYMDGQVKNTKSMMLSRVRKKKKDLISMLPEAIVSPSRDGNCSNRARYLDDVRDALSNALQVMRGSALTGFERGVAPAQYPTVENGNATTKTLVEGRKRLPRFGESGNRKKQAKTQEQCLIESSPDALRVSFLFKQQSMASSDPLEAAILYQWMRFFHQQAEEYKILRRKSVDGYSISFLILGNHLKELCSKNIESSIMNFCAAIDKECSDIKIQVNAQARVVAAEFFKEF